MNRLEKESLVGSLHNRFVESKGTFLVSVKGLTVAEVQHLRRAVRQEGGYFKVAKNTLLHRASEGVPGMEVLQPYFAQQIAVVFSSDAPAVARVLHQSAKTVERLSLVAGAFEGTLLDRSRVEFLATLPPREQLLGQLCASLQAPMASCVGTLQQVLSQLVWTLQQVSEGKQ